jgi:hypothetical protein
MLPLPSPISAVQLSVYPSSHNNFLQNQPCIWSICQIAKSSVTKTCLHSNTTMLFKITGNNYHLYYSLTDAYLFKMESFLQVFWSICGTVQLKCDGTWWRTGGKVKGKLVNGVGSQYSSHYLRTWCMQHYYRFKWNRPFRWKTKPCFCACAITFQTQSTHFS